MIAGVGVGDEVVQSSSVAQLRTSMVDAVDGAVHCF
jgi:hypothetical protein